MANGKSLAKKMTRLKTLDCLTCSSSIQIMCWPLDLLIGTPRGLASSSSTWKDSRLL